MKKIKVMNIQSVKGQISTTSMEKNTLSAFDDKRWYISPTKSLGYGHPDTPECLNESNEIKQNIPPGCHKNSPFIHTPLDYQNLWSAREKLGESFFSK